MPSNFPTRALITPSYIVPEVITTTSQASDFQTLLSGEAPQVRLSSIDKAVIQYAIDVRTGVHANQATHNRLPSPSITGQMLGTATYMARNRADWTEWDEMEAGSWNVNLPQAYELGMDQGIYQFMRSACLYGVIPSNGEGLLNTPNATSVNLPADSFGNTTWTTYDNGQLALFLLSQLRQAFTRVYNLGMQSRVAILGPQRILGYAAFEAVVQTTNYQRPGAGTSTSLQMAKDIAKEMGYSFTIGYDDTLIGKGAGGTDAVIMVIPELYIATRPGINTNAFAGLMPNQRAMTMMFTDMNKPRRIRTPIVEGVDVTSSLRMTSGWAPRGQAVTVFNIPP